MSGSSFDSMADGRRGRRCRRRRQPQDVDTESIGYNGQYSYLATSLLSKWGWGLLAGIDVQRLAHDAERDGCVHPDIRRLASLGARGNSPQHIAEQLRTDNLKNCMTPEPEIMMVKVWDPLQQEVVDEDRSGCRG